MANDLDRIIDFIEDWAGVSAKPSQPRATANHLPETIKKLDARMGAFWDSPPYPFSPDVLDHNTERGLFKVQDFIEDSRGSPNSEGLTSLISENQGVWSLYYNQEHDLFFKGDWTWGQMDSSYLPSPFPAKLEDALCFTLLVNFFFYMDNCTWERTPTWPDDITVKLWHHSSWGYFKGFWTNSDGSALLFDQMGIIRK